MLAVQLVTYWVDSGDLDANSIDAIGRGDRAVIAFAFRIIAHDDKVDFRAQISITDEIGRVVDSETAFQKQFVDGSGPMDLEWAYTSQSGGWSAGTYTVEILVQGQQTENTSAAGRHEFEIVEPLIHYRGSSLNAVGNNAVIRARGYTHRWMAETSYSSVKRSLGDAVRAQFWYREFREIILLFALSSIERCCEPL